ncbi:uncharacterized protein IL334_002930 [Kwoniella shivajii]|uniref:Aminoglycoside phosphotransferase domain-containing protein n=1 Tax=Kwoniella shivajii TaxID=564305 RepID=A0ABZ1CW38_9TREE|nr:hypothetical protein IL334_002930 [Kwoniella shivajii]
MSFIQRSKCHFGDCPTSVITTFTNPCCWCGAIFCPTHNTEAFHPCRDILNLCRTYEQKSDTVIQGIVQRAATAMYDALLTEIRQAQPDIVKNIEHLRPGHSFTFSLPDGGTEMSSQSDMHGATNYHIPISFDDGVKWLLRVRQSTNGVPPYDFQQAVTVSEVRTLQILKEKGMPVPNAWMPLIERTKASTILKEPSLSYLFCEFLSGTPVNLPKDDADSMISPGSKTRLLIREFAKSQILLSSAPFATSLIGSLTSAPVDGQVESDVVKAGPLVDFGFQHLADPPNFPGPFQTNQERYLSFIDIALSHIANQYIHQANTLDAYLWHLQLRELISNCSRLNQRPFETYIRHADAKGDHLMQEIDGKITGIIDWECAYVTTKAEAFSAPLFIYYNLESTFSENDFTPAEKVLIESYHQLGRPDMAGYIRDGKIYQRLGDIGGYWHTKFMQSDVLEVFNCDIPDSFQPPLYVGSDWRLYIYNRYRDDPNLQEIIRQTAWNEKEENRLAAKGKKKRERERKAYWALSPDQRAAKIDRERTAHYLALQKAKPTPKRFELHVKEEDSDTESEHSIAPTKWRTTLEGILSFFRGRQGRDH